MKRPEATKYLNERLTEMGVQPHRIGIKQINPAMEISVVAGGAIITKKLRSGVTRHEIEIALEDIERFINLKDGTVDIEELLAEPAE
jgi:hypothetical protein